MQTNATVKITVGIFVTVATGFILLYYLRKRKDRSHKKIRSAKPTKSSERSAVKTRGRLQTARRITSPKYAKKTIDSTKMRYSISSEISSDSLNKRGISSTSRKVKDYSSLLEGSQISFSPISSTPKILLPSEKSKGSQDNKMLASNTGKLPSMQLSTTPRYDKMKPSESVRTTKLLAAKETPSPTEVITIDSYCYCGQDAAISADAAGQLDENCKVELLPTIVKPVSFDPYSPEDLTQVEGASDEMSKNSMQMNLKPKNHHIIIPFLPILHAITYASKHSQLLQELLQNYDYYESQFT